MKIKEKEEEGEAERVLGENVSANEGCKEEKYWLAADYFDSFKCKCGDCRHTCCGGWRIAVGEEEYFRIIGMDCSERLHEKIEGAFVRPKFPTHERYMLMEADWTGRCRMLDDDGMCMLQKECGEDSITEVCRVYPRSYKSENGRLAACCSSSCEAVVELLLRSEPLTFRTEPEMQFSPEKHVKPEIVENVQYDVNRLFSETVEILQDRTIPLAQRIGKIADKSGVEQQDYGIWKKISREGLLHTILPIIREFCDEAPSFTDYVEEFERRYLNRADEALKKLHRSVVGEEDGITLSEADETAFIRKYDADIQAFEEAFPDWSCYFENLICNNMLYCSFPNVDRRVDTKMAVLGISLQYTLLRIMCICHTAEQGYTREALVDVMAEVYHVVEHTAFYFNAVVLAK